MTIRNSNRLGNNFDPKLTIPENINKYWGVKVEGYWWGLPLQALNDDFKHPDIIRVKWDGDSLKITRRS